ncbi:MAG: hypothetical protein GY874_17715 [Desulfobacteraceae bacterium]|nr:hypothetical protein [Desulfobacteraceae bacterium]
MRSKSVLFFMLVFIVVLMFSEDDAHSDSNAGFYTERNVKYEVIFKGSGGNPSHEIEFNGPENDNTIVTDVPETPWTFEFITDSNDFHVYIIANTEPCPDSLIHVATFTKINVYIDGELYRSVVGLDKIVIDDSLENILLSDCDDPASECDDPAPLTACDGPDIIPDQYLIFFNEGVDWENEINRLSCIYDIRVDGLDLFPEILNFWFSATMSEATLNLLRCEESVKSIYCNSVVSINP